MRSFTLAALVATQTAALDVLDRRSAFRFFGKNEAQNRAARANTGFFEEMGDDNFQRECLEEQCDKQECAEAQKSDEKFKDVDPEKLWQSLTKACSLEGSECNPRGSAQCIQNWGFRTCVCHTFGFLKKGETEAVEMSAFKAADDYQTPELFHKKTFSKKYGDVEHKDEGDCAEPVDVCGLYATDESAREICNLENEVCRNNIVSQNGEAIKYGKDHLGFVCDCLPGFVRDPTVEDINQAKCVPINPCPGLCPSADTECIFDPSTRDAYCQCKNAGYEYDETTQSCFDIDECDSQCDPSENKECVNSEGSFSCTCAEGYNAVTDENNKDGFVCEENDPCENNTCPEDASCVANGLLDYSCECNDEAFKFDDDSNSCLAKSCEEANVICGQNSSCQQENNEPATCYCDIGYDRDMISGGCVDIDECNTECNGQGQICDNLPGSYECSCAPGFEKGNDPFGSDECFDIDECDTECDNEGYACTNTIGSFICECEVGYERDADGECKQSIQKRPNIAADSEPVSYDCEDEFEENEEDELGNLDLNEVDDLADFDEPPLMKDQNYN